ncbi:MAG: hypothetical protein ABWX96_01825 [Propionibacteriaceae bacterium]
MGVVVAVVLIALGVALVWWVPIDVPLLSAPVAGFILIGVGVVMIGWAVLKGAERARLRSRGQDSYEGAPPGV